MRPDIDGELGKIFLNAYRNILRRSDQPIRAAQECAEDAAPCSDVESPLSRPAGETRGAANRVRFATVMTIFGHKMVLRTNREVIVERAIEWNADGRGQLEYRSRQPVHMMKMQARDANGLQDVSE